MPQIKWNRIGGRLLQAVLGVSAELLMALFLMLAALLVSWLAAGVK